MPDHCRRDRPGPGIASRNERYPYTSRKVTLLPKVYRLLGTVLPASQFLTHEGCTAGRADLTEGPGN